MPKNLELAKYQLLQRTFEPISKEAGYDVVEASNDKIIPVSELTADNQKIAIFDDFVCEKNQKPLVDFFIRGRHKNCSVINLSQSYYKSPKDIRLNCSHFGIYEFPSSNEVSMICRENNVDKEKCRKATKVPFSFLFVDKPRKFISRKFDEIDLKIISYSNGLLSEASSQTTRGQQGVGFKLTSSGDYDLENKKCTNVADAMNPGDAVTKGQLDKKSDSTAVLLLKGQNHMTGDLDMRGKKIILPGEINMNRKLIKDLNIDENDDLSAVNMATLKKFSTAAKPQGIAEDIDRLDKFNVKNSKQQSFAHLASNYDNLVSYDDVKSIFLSRKETFAMAADLDMGESDDLQREGPNCCGSGGEQKVRGRGNGEEFNESEPADDRY